MPDRLTSADDALAPVGQCPLCDGQGPIASPCAESICVRRGYHFVPADGLRSRASGRDRDPVVGRSVGPWLVIDVLGAGAFGVVYLVQGASRQLGACKLIGRAGDDPEKVASVLKKFQLECEALAALDHPNIVGLLDAGTWDGGPFLVMEYVAGGLTLKRLIEQRRALGQLVEPAVAWHVLRQLLSALGSAHAPPRSIVHRDIKPENLMIREQDGDPCFLKVLDFGLAKFMQDGTETTQAMGTPAYMAPEQLWKQGIGPWTDLYAVGVIACELLVGGRPFSGTSEEIVQRKATPGYDVLSELGADLDPAVQAFVRKALAYEPHMRFVDADDMACALDLLPQFSGLAAEYGDHVDMDPEKLRLKRMQEQMQAERRRLDEERRRLEQERAQLSQGLGTGPQPDLTRGVPLGTAPQPTMQQRGDGGSRGGLFLGLAGGVLLVGVLLVVGKAYLSTKAEENTATAIASPTAPAQPANPVAVPAGPDTQAPPPADVAAAAPVVEPDAASAALADVAPGGEPDVQVAAADIAPAPAADIAVSIGSTAEPAQPERPKAPTPTHPPAAPKAHPPAAAHRPDPGSAIGEAFRKSQAQLQAQAAAERERQAQQEARKKAFQDSLGKEFKKSQTK